MKNSKSPSMNQSKEAQIKMRVEFLLGWLRFFINHINNFYMRQYLLPLLLVSVSLAQNQQKYTLFTKINNPESFQRIAFSDDLSQMMLYGEENSITYDFYGYNYSKRGYTALVNQPTVVTFFTDSKSLNNILYGSRNGELRKRLFNQNMYSDSQIFKVADDQQSIQEIVVSSDGQYYATFCEQGQTVYIGKTSATELPDSHSYEDKGIINSINWRPSSSQLLISGGNSTDSNYFELYNLQDKTTEDLSAQSDSTVVSAAFNANGNKIYFIEDNSDQIIKIYDYRTKKLSQVTVKDANQLRRLSIRGNFLSVYDESFVFVFDIKNGEVEYGSYSSTLVSGGLSPDGSDLVTFSLLDNTDITIYKLCGLTHSYYNSDQDNCQECSANCGQCYFQPDKCSSCLEDSYIQNSKCLLCSDQINHCISCSSATVCTRCNPSQHRVPSEQGKSCVCDLAYHWIASGSSCICDQGYLAEDEICQLCSKFIENCQTCDRADSCLSCSQGYAIDQQGKRCKKHSDIALIVILSIAGFIVVGAIVMALIVKRKRSKKMSTLLQSVEGNQIDQN